MVLWRGGVANKSLIELANSPARHRLCVGWTQLWVFIFAEVNAAQALGVALRQKTSVVRPLQLGTTNYKSQVIAFPEVPTAKREADFGLGWSRGSARQVAALANQISNLGNRPPAR